jgi:hypothetical protein
VTARPGDLAGLFAVGGAGGLEPWGADSPLGQQDAVEHGEDGLLLGLGEAAQALELALEPGGWARACRDASWCGRP